MASFLAVPTHYIGVSFQELANAEIVPIDDRILPRALKVSHRGISFCQSGIELPRVDSM
jgi:hypothetical protein